MISSVRTTFTKAKGEKMAMLTLEDLTGKCDAVVFPRTYEQVAELLKPDAMVFVSGTIDRRRERTNILIDEIIPIDEAVEKFTGRILLRLRGRAAGGEKLKGIRKLLPQHKGAVPILFELIPTGRADVRAVVQADRACSVTPSRGLIDALVEIMGDQEYVKLIPRPDHGQPNGNGRGRKSFRRRNGGGNGSSANGNGGYASSGSNASGGNGNGRLGKAAPDSTASEAVTRFD
jgi:DNA polymerase-3 subunit alpha